MRGFLGEKIGEGASADIRLWAPGQIVKLFKIGALKPRHDAARPMRHSVGTPQLEDVQ